jgi:hypothetical protein
MRDVSVKRDGSARGILSSYLYMSVGPLPLDPSSLVPTAEEIVDDVVVDVLERLGIGGSPGGRGLPGIGGMGVPERLGVDGTGLLGIGGMMSLYALKVDVEELNCSGVSLEEPDCFGVSLGEPDCF